MKKAVIIILAILAILIAGILWYLNNDSSDPYSQTSWGKFSGECKTSELPDKDYGSSFVGCDYDVPEQEIPIFDEVSFPFTNEFNSAVSLPLMALAMIDIDNDGVDEVFICLLYTSPSPRDQRGSRMPSSA